VHYKAGPMVVQQFGQEVVYFDCKQILWGGDTAQKIQSGLHQFHFGFVIPDKLPPSFKGTHGSITYEMQATVVVAGMFSANLKSAVPLNIVCQFGTLKLEPELFEAQKTVPFHKDDPIKINAWMEQQVAEVGGNIKLHIEISNDSPKKLKKAKLDIIGHQRFFAGGANKLENVNAYGLELQDGFPIESGKKMSKVLDMRLPSTMQPSIPKELSAIIHMYYEMKFVLDIEGLFSGKAELAIPVLVGPAIPPELQGVQMPTTPMGEVGKIIVQDKDNQKHYPQAYWWQPWCTPYY